MDIFSGKNVLDTICGLVGHSTGAQTVAVVEVLGKSSSKIRGAWGSHQVLLSGNAQMPNFDRVHSPLKLESGLQRSKWFKKHNLWQIAPFAEKMIAIALDDTEGQNFFYLTALWNSDKLPVDAQYFTKVTSLICMVLTSAERGISDVAKELSGFKETVVEQGPLPTGEEAVLAFLSNTLIEKVNLRCKSGCSYITLRSWKVQLKQVQISALEGLKIVPSQVAADFIASELEKAVNQIFGGLLFQAVVPVPSGSAGKERSLSVAIAESLSKIIGVPFENVLKGETSFGRSHPHKSKNLKPYTLTKSLKGHVLLIDDVVTTGRHMILSTEALKEGGAAVVALGWVG